MKSTPDRPETIMLLTALPPAPPTPHTMMRGFNSVSWRGFRLIGTCLSGRASADAVSYPRDETPSENRLQPAPPYKDFRLIHAYGLAEIRPGPTHAATSKRANLRGRLLALMVNIRFTWARTCSRARLEPPVALARQRASRRGDQNDDGDRLDHVSTTGHSVNLPPPPQVV